MERQERIAQIRKQLRNGDINRIAKRAGVSREWVSRVLQNRVVSEPVLKAAEAMLAERQSRPSEHS
ncbi:MAG TPA: LacI family DNA-binding transcriptional regulator [Candidatus Tidjanibacter faecipullorum]|uniref:LacI family DNA-binding transcriptional regulator n=1 Tax=Candidatus Tidjanibacter faecipullorum TaxID=2838766 RepID=A0A9D2IL68_9BACT|nr:LacI family DNA-binding transcriptional regulator [Candidatus Tidjanibacter faecipullorum]